MSTCVRRLALAAVAAFCVTSRVAAAEAAGPAVPQGGAEAAAIDKILAGITLPPGFRIGLYALVPDARMIAVAPAGDATIVSTRRTKIYRLTGAGDTGVGVRPFAPAVRFDEPNGVCFAADGTLYTVEKNRILAFPAAGSGDPVPTTVVKQGALIPAAEESDNHSARVCRIGPDGKLYVALGQPYNVPPAGKLELYAKWGIGGIVRMDRDGGGREVFARGIRNSVGMDFDPKDRTLWFTDNQVDLMGDDKPPGELNHATRTGQNFGFPWYGGGHVRTVEYRDETPPASVVFPAVEEVAHAADLGMVVYTGTMFPAAYRGAIFSAQHGSWNRSVPVGARVMVTLRAADGSVAQGSKPFAEGWLNKAGEYDGRPVDVAQLPDGSLLVSDDLAGAVYRITYDGAT